MVVEKRLYSDVLDSIIGEGVNLHIEYMGDGSWYLGVEKGNDVEQFFFQCSSIVQDGRKLWTRKMEKKNDGR